MNLYCASRYVAKRRASSEVQVGEVRVGGGNPIAVQSMTTTPTQDVEATVAQSIRLAEAGCQIVRITAQNIPAAKALGEIRKKFNAAGFAKIPLVADIHFLPKAALEAAEHVEKVRINPGNYADKKKFQVREYDDSAYAEELDRLREAFTPIVVKCRDLGRAMRIGTNHGSLSDRIMNRYGDSPLGMCESALEFLRIAESLSFRNIIISMKASNPKVAIQAYRLMVAKMAEEDMHYPLHLGVTEAGDGDDARIKSAIGIGSLLFDGLGDTIRVSLTEDPVAEIPVAQDLARKAENLWTQQEALAARQTQRDSLDPYHYRRRNVVELSLGENCTTGPLEPPRTILPAGANALRDPQTFAAELRRAHNRLSEALVEGLLIDLEGGENVANLPEVANAVREQVKFLVLDITEGGPGVLRGLELPEGLPIVLLFRMEEADPRRLKQLRAFTQKKSMQLALDASPAVLGGLIDELAEGGTDGMLFTLSKTPEGTHAHGAYRQIVELLGGLNCHAPIWIRNTSGNAVALKDYFGDQLLEASILSGNLICDGIGDFVSVETVSDLTQATALVYNILQGARARTTKTEYVACPSCGRTLFDLQETTQKIRAATGHLNGVTIAVMGCIVNGPGEMADADFGYVGGAPGKINLYVGKTPVKFNIPSNEAVDRLIDLIKEHGKWNEPKPRVEETVS